MKNEKVQKQLDRILDLFQSGNLPDAIKKTYLQSEDVPCTHWSLGNQILALLAGTNDARGFKQWNKVDRKVKSGSKAFFILAPQYWKKETENEETGEKEIIERLFFRGVPVFKYEDTEGKELPQTNYTPKNPPPLKEIADYWNINIKYTGKSTSYWGYFSPSKKEIMLCTHDAAVFFHEIAHAAHEKVKGILKPGQDWKQEIVAELSASVLAALHGYDWEKHSYQYIKSYVPKGKNVHSACMSVLNDTQKVLNMLLNPIPKENKTAA